MKTQREEDAEPKANNTAKPHEWAGQQRNEKGKHSGTPSQGV